MFQRLLQNPFRRSFGKQEFEGRSEMNREKLITALALSAVALLLVQAIITGSALSSLRTAVDRQTEILQGQNTAGGTETEALKVAADAMNSTAARVAQLLDSAEEGTLNSGGRDAFLQAAILLSTATDESVCNYSAQILGRIGGEKAESRLLEMARDHAGSRSTILSALREMGSRHTSELVLESLRSSNLRDIQHAAGQLSNVITPKMLPDILEILSELPPGGQSEYRHIRRGFYDAIRRLGDPRACEAMLDAAAEEMEDYGRQSAMQAFSHCLDNKHLMLVEKAFRTIGSFNNERNRGQYTELLRRMGQLGDLRAGEYLVEVIDGTNDQYLTRVAIEGLRNLRDPLAAEAICKCLNSKDANVRRYAEQLCGNGYPGIKEVDGSYTVVSEEEMQKLLVERARKVEALEQRFGENGE